MPTEAKRATVEALSRELSGATTSIVTDYRGLTVADLAAIRRSLRPSGVSFRVVKNRLAKIAAASSGNDALAELLSGPSAIALGPGDESAIAKALLDALRPYRNVKVRGAIVGRQRVEGDEVTRLATLPPRDVLLGQLAGAVSSPLGTMAGLLNAPLRNLAYALQQVADRKAAQGA